MEGLFDRWERNVKSEGLGFVRDGIIDMNMWNKEESDIKPRIVFLLKEAYIRKPDKHGEYSKSWDLRDDIKSFLKKDHHTWWRCALWAYGIHELFETGDLPEFPGWDKDGWFYKDELRMPEVKNALLSSAIVNIKKFNGKSRSTPDDLLYCINRDKCFIKEQIDLINPDIIVCGSTWPLILESKVFGESVPKRESDWVYRWDDKIFLDYWHPQQRRSEKIDYRAVTGAIYHWKNK